MSHVAGVTVRLTVIALLGLLPFHLASFTGHLLRLCQSASALTCALSLTKRREGDATRGSISAEVNLLKHPRKTFPGLRSPVMSGRSLDIDRETWGRSAQPSDESPTVFTGPLI